MNMHNKQFNQPKQGDPSMYQYGSTSQQSYRDMLNYDKKSKQSVLDKRQYDQKYPTKNPSSQSQYGSQYSGNGIPYGSQNNPYAQYQQQSNPYRQQSNPYAQQSYAQQSYAQQSNPYAQQPNPYAQQNNPYAQQLNPSLRSEMQFPAYVNRSGTRPILTGGLGLARQSSMDKVATNRQFNPSSTLMRFQPQKTAYPPIKK
jgi:hypothetical protein